MRFFFKHKYMKIIKQIPKEKEYKRFMHKKCKIKSLENAEGEIVGYTEKKEYGLSYFIVKTVYLPSHDNKMSLTRFLNGAGFEIRCFKTDFIYQKIYRLCELKDLDIEL